MAALQHEYVSVDEVGAHPAAWWQTVLGVAGFDRLPRLHAGSKIPVAASMTPSLGAGDDLCEVWRVTGGAGVPLEEGYVGQGRMHCRYGDDFLFGSILIEEPSSGGAAGLLQATRQAYGEIFDVLRETGHRHLIRVWNYLPEINREADGDERYRHFNSARQTAFLASGRETVGTVPAACALGSPAGSPISIYYLAARQSPLMIENPRQMSAYHYPRKFGMHSPTFSRACVLRESAGTNFFVSGTASILGSETIHGGDVTAQTRETLNNIDALLGEANRVLGERRYTLDGLKFKVYVRQPDDLAAIERALSSALQPLTPIVYLQADVCREDLLVEIEATGASV